MSNSSAHYPQQAIASQDELREGATSSALNNEAENVAGGVLLVCLGSEGSSAYNTQNESS